MNADFATPPIPTPRCQSFAPRLALLGDGSLDAATEAETRAHLESCAWCRAKLATFAVVDAALVRHFGAERASSAPLTMAAILAADEQSDSPTGTQPSAPRALHPRPLWRGRGSALLAIACTLALIVAAGAVFSALPHGPGAGSTVPATPSVALSPTALLPTAVPTNTPLPPCALYTGAGGPFQSVPGVPGLQLPAGSYLSAASRSGGGVGQYTVQAYTVCFAGSESAIDGDVYSPGASPTSALGKLVAAGWTLSHLFPDNFSFAMLNHCTGASALCLNDAGTPSPFTFLAVDQFFTRAGGLTTFRLQVATIATPACLNDPKYYSGTPHYTLYEEGNAPTDATYYFYMPPATRVSSFKDSSTGSHYVYFCSAGTTATIVNFLEQSMQADGWVLTGITASGFVAQKGNSPSYRIDVSVAGPGNYALRIYNPS